MANTLTQPNTGILHHVEQAAGGMPGATFGRDASTLGKNARAILGDTVSITRNFNGNDIGLHEGPSQSTYGIPFAINGRATVVEDEISIWMASKQDPIKSVFGISLHADQKVVFKRKYVKGGQALIVPERAPARTISIAFDQREERMTRIAIALEQSTYLYLRPDDARDDLRMKLEGIQTQMHNAWVSITYAKAFENGVNIVDALMRGSVISASLSDVDRALEGNQRYMSQFCGIISKSKFPLKSLAQSMALAMIYTPTGATREKPAMMLVPPGAIDLTRFQKAESMTYSISGLTDDNPKNQVKMPLDEIYAYPDSNLMVAVHTPPASYRTGGAAFPQVDQNEMQTPVVQGIYYVEKVPGAVNTYNNVGCYDCWITGFKTKEWEHLPRIGDAGGGVSATIRRLLPAVGRSAKPSAPVTGLTRTNAMAEGYLWYLRPQFVTNNDSAILSTKPGSETGEMLYSYPGAFASSSQNTGQFTMLIAFYCTAAVRARERLIILNGIKYNGFIGGHGSTVLEPGGDKYHEDAHDLLPFITKTAPWDIVNLWKDVDFKAQAIEYNVYKKEYFEPTSFNKNIANLSEVPVCFSRGTTRMDDGYKPRHINNGGLGVLDHIANIDVIQGYPMYNDIVNPAEH